MTRFSWTRTAAVLTGTLVVASIASLPTVAQAAPDHLEPPPACTTVVTGTLSGAQSVAAGEKLCLRGALVEGAITVAEGGALASSRSTVEGAITLAGATRFAFCRSTTVVGAITVTGTVGSVRIGNNHDCGPNTIDGAVTIQDNFGNVSIAHSTVTGAVTVSGNAATSGLAPRIVANVIDGDLTCAGNAPAASNTGRPNTVGGARTGECADPTF